MRYVLETFVNTVPGVDSRVTKTVLNLVVNIFDR